MKNSPFTKAIDKLVKERGNRIRVAAELDVSERSIMRWQIRGLGDSTVRHIKAVLMVAELSGTPLEQILR